MTKICLKAMKCFCLSKSFLKTKNESSLNEKRKESSLNQSSRKSLQNRKRI